NITGNNIFTWTPPYGTDGQWIIGISAYDGEDETAHNALYINVNPMDPQAWIVPPWMPVVTGGEQRVTHVLSRAINVGGGAHNGFAGDSEIIGGDAGYPKVISGYTVTDLVAGIDIPYNADGTPVNDNDGDLIGNEIDADDDNDNVADISDIFPFNQSEWADFDEDGTGDNADPDDDNDGWSDADEIASGSNPLNAAVMPVDSDGDGIPDPMEPDKDNDGVSDDNDAFPANPAESRDADNDGIGNNGDTDDDNDGYSDVDEITEGLDSLDSASKPRAAKDLELLLDEYLSDTFVIGYTLVTEADPLKTRRIVRVYGEGKEYKLEYNAYGDIVKLTCPDGRIFQVTNTYDGSLRLTSSTVTRITEDYEAAVYLPGYYASPIYDTFSPDGSSRIFVIDLASHNILHMEVNGTEVESRIEGFISPTIIALDETRGTEGTLWVVDGTELVKIDLATDTRTVSTLPFVPDQIILDKAEGSAWVIDKVNHEIQKIDRDGNALFSVEDEYGVVTTEPIGTETGYGYAIVGSAAIDQSGDLYYVEYFSEIDPASLAEQYAPKLYLTKLDKDGALIDRVELMAFMDADKDDFDKPFDAVIDIKNQSVWVAKRDSEEGNAYGAFNISFAGIEISHIIPASVVSMILPDPIYDGAWLTDANMNLERHDASGSLLDSANVGTDTARYLLAIPSTGEIVAIDTGYYVFIGRQGTSSPTNVFSISYTYTDNELTGYTVTDQRAGADKKFDTRTYAADGRLMTETAADQKTIFAGFGYKGYGDIQDAIDSASAGDKVLIGEGTFELTETLELKEGVTLEGTLEFGDKGGRLTTLIGPEAGSVISVTNISIDTKIRNLYIVNRSTGTAEASSSAIYLNAAMPVYIEDNIIEGGSFGISLANVAGAIIWRNLIRDTETAIIATEDSPQVIQFNTFANNGNAISLDVYFNGTGYSTYNSIDSNIFFANDKAILIIDNAAPGENEKPLPQIRILSNITFQNTKNYYRVFPNGGGTEGAFTPADSNPDRDPVFVDPENGNYTIGANSQDSAWYRGWLAGEEYIAEDGTKEIYDVYGNILKGTSADGTEITTYFYVSGLYLGYEVRANSILTGGMTVYYDEDGLFNYAEEYDAADGTVTIMSADGVEITITKDADPSTDRTMNIGGVEFRYAADGTLLSIDYGMDMVTDFTSYGITATLDAYDTPSFEYIYNYNLFGDVMSIELYQLYLFDTVITFTPEGGLMSIKDASPALVEYEDGYITGVTRYDENGNIISDSIATYTYERDSEGSIIYTYVEVDGVTRKYDSRDILIESEDEDGSRLYYDDDGNVTKSVSSAGIVIAYEYKFNASGDITETKLNVYDEMYELITRYTLLGKLSYIMDEEYTITRFNTDGFVESMTTVDGKTTKYSYEKDASGNVTFVIVEGEGLIAKYDNDGRLIETTDLSGNFTEYYTGHAAYPDGLIKSITDISGRVYTYTYEINAATKQAEETILSLTGQNEVWHYDETGRLIKVVYASGTTVEYNADGTSIGYPVAGDPGIYDSDVRLIRTIDAFGYAAEYKNGLIHKVTSPEGFIARYYYQKDKDDNVISMTVQRELEARDEIDRAKSDLAAMLGINTGEIEDKILLAGVKPVFFRDDTLGGYKTAEPPAAGIIAGIEIALSVNNIQYTYHAQLGESGTSDFVKIDPKSAKIFTEALF
ncbi:MAG: NosD domain-containing protein, partial [Candidatus Omnitrophota bacterium]|nr:NosD domain-containing protein [Candidatus Omnitrophota bacterium]